MSDIGRCDSLIEGSRCSGVATHVLRSSFATRLICDDCAKVYGQTSAAVMQFTLELEPARKLLLSQLDRTKGAYMKKLAAIDIHGQTAQDFAHGRAIVAALGIGAMMMVAVHWWGPLIIFAGWIATNGLIQYTLNKRAAVKLAALDKQLGFPELTL